MLIMLGPQFETQDDFGEGPGIPPTPEWQSNPPDQQYELLELGGSEVDATVGDAFIRLRNIFRQAQRSPLAPTRLHDLACFVLHRLLAVNPDENSTQTSAIS